MSAKTSLRAAVYRSTMTLAVYSSVLSLAACSAIDDNGANESSESSKRYDIRLGLLLPDRDTARFEDFDYPIIKKEVASLTYGKGKVLYANAGASMVKQSQQFQRMIDDKVDVILVDAVDSKLIASDVRRAKDAGIPVIAYDRLAQGPIDAYISHDNQLVGQIQGRAIVEKLAEKASRSKVVMMNGDPADPNTAHFKDGALGELEGNVEIVKRYDIDRWSPIVAKKNMQQAIQSVGLDNIAAVYAANDGMAGAVVEALKEAGASRIPPVTGQDANLDAVQRVVAGEQYMTVYKPFLDEATYAAQMAVKKVQGHDIQFDALTRDRVDSPTQKKIPAMLVPVVPITRDNIQETLIADGVYTIQQICTETYAAACAAIGLKKS